MEASISFAAKVPVFCGQNYQVWSIKMMAFLRAFDLWDAVEHDIDPPPFTEKRIVEKVLVSLPEKFEHKISSLEDSKDMTQMKLSELVNALQAVEQRKAIRQEVEGAVEGAFIANERGKGQFKYDEEMQFLDKSGKEKRDFQKDQQNNNCRGKKEPYPPCPHCGKMTHTTTYCWFRPGVKCRSCKQFGHVEKVCKAKAKQYEKVQVAENVDQEVEELFVVVVVESCSSMFLGSNSWFIDSGCTHHMTSNLAIFKTLDRSYFSMVRLGNGELVEVKGKGTVTVNTPTGIRYICDVLYVPYLSQNLISVGQLLENDYSVHFHDECVDVVDKLGVKLFTAGMNHRNFSVDWSQTEIKA
ncbi:hypothetical protein SLEP1_g59734 [Rubroshorea leprosula]|uniref:CCHC-type domain-containing protein n=1 Tax=Rubroshorea leprosula TaxID=152421 RepID=A0AAV5MUB8_9ROSI|nr:hypothetical protein SLEP1_g59734 [Rubroshorea leprosula]